MKITDLKCAVIGQNPVVRIVTDEGISGYGEVESSKPYLKPHVLFYREFILGKDPTDVERVMLGIRRYGGFKPWGSSVSAIEMALWDIVGKVSEQPIYNLIGGPVRPTIRVYANGWYAGSSKPKEYASKAAETVGQGFTAMKFDLDDGNRPEKIDRWNWTVHPAELEVIVAEAHEIREAVGADMDLAIDLHGRYDATAVVKVAHALEDLNLMWLEEPVPPENIDALAKVKAASCTPICVGENLYLRYGFRELLEKQAADIIMPDISKCGGLSECRKIANMAEIYYVPFAPHNNSGPLSTLADAHTCASVPNFLALEYHRFRDEGMEKILLKDEPLIEQGHVVLNEKPGLGAELNEDHVRTMMPEGDDGQMWR